LYIYIYIYIYNLNLPSIFSVTDAKYFVQIDCYPTKLWWKEKGVLYLNTQSQLWRQNGQVNAPQLITSC